MYRFMKIKTVFCFVIFCFFSCFCFADGAVNKAFSIVSAPTDYSFVTWDFFADHKCDFELKFWDANDEMVALNYEGVWTRAGDKITAIIVCEKDSHLNGMFSNFRNMMDENPCIVRYSPENMELVIEIDVSEGSEIWISGTKMEFHEAKHN